MRNNSKVAKAIISLLAVIILIVLLFFFLQKFSSKNDASNKENGIVNTEDIDKDSEKIAENNPETDSANAGQNPTTANGGDTKNQEEVNALNAISKEQGITVFMKAANFGSTAEILIDSSKINSSYNYYQFFQNSKPISNIESITKVETTIFPAQEAGNEVVLKLLDGNKKVVKKLDVVLNEKK